MTTTKKNLHIPSSIVGYLENGGIDDDDDDDTDIGEDEDDDDEDFHYHLASLFHPKRISSKYHSKGVSKTYPSKGHRYPTKDYFHPTKDYPTIRPTQQDGDRFLQSKLTTVTIFTYTTS